MENVDAFVGADSLVGSKGQVLTCLLCIVFSAPFAVSEGLRRTAGSAPPVYHPRQPKTLGIAGNLVLRLGYALSD